MGHKNNNKKPRKIKIKAEEKFRSKFCQINSVNCKKLNICAASDLLVLERQITNYAKITETTQASKIYARPK